MASLQPETIIHFQGFEITNTVIATIFTDAILVLLLIVAVKSIKKIPNLFQIVLEMGIEYFYTLTQQIAGKNTDKIFPWFMSFFLVIFIANLVGLFPGFGSIGFVELGYGEHAESHFTPLLRGMTSDFNVTLALATISIVATHIIAVRTTGFKAYISRFISLNPILLFVGILELVSEFTKLFSLSFRLFGNIYAGEVVLTTISGLFAFLAPIPFLLLEVIVAVVQALVFSMLTMVFMSILATPHGEGGEH